MKFRYPKADEEGCLLRPLPRLHPFATLPRGRSGSKSRFAINTGKLYSTPQPTDPQEADDESTITPAGVIGDKTPHVIEVDLDQMQEWPADEVWREQDTEAGIIPKLYAGGFAHFAWLEITYTIGGEYGATAQTAEVKDSLDPKIEGWDDFPRRIYKAEDGGTTYAPLAMIIKKRDPRYKNQERYVAKVYEFVLLDLAIIAPIVNFKNSVGAWPPIEPGITVTPSTHETERGVYIVHSPIITDLSNVQFEEP